MYHIGEANLYAKKKIKNHWWQNDTFLLCRVSKNDKNAEKVEKKCNFCTISRLHNSQSIQTFLQQNVSYCEANLYVYKIKKNHWWQNNTFCYIGLAKMTRMRNRWKNAIFAQLQAFHNSQGYTKLTPRNVSYCETQLICSCKILKHLLMAP